MKGAKAIRIDLIDAGDKIYSFMLWTNPKNDKKFNAISDVMYRTLCDFKRWIETGKKPKAYTNDDRAQIPTNYHQ